VWAKTEPHRSLSFLLSGYGQERGRSACVMLGALCIRGGSILKKCINKKRRGTERKTAIFTHRPKKVRLQPSRGTPAGKVPGRTKALISPCRVSQGGGPGAGSMLAGGEGLSSRRKMRSLPKLKTTAKSLGFVRGRAEMIGKRGRRTGSRRRSRDGRERVTFGGVESWTKASKGNSDATKLYQQGEKGIVSGKTVYPRGGERARKRLRGEKRAGVDLTQVWYVLGWFRCGKGGRNRKTGIFCGSQRGRVRGPSPVGLLGQREPASEASTNALKGN